MSKNRTSPPAVTRLPVIGDSTPDNGNRFRTMTEEFKLPGVKIVREIIMLTTLTLTGTAPCLIHRFDPDKLNKPKVKTGSEQQPSEQEAALNGLYEDPEGKNRIVIPRDNIKAMLRWAGVYVPLKGRKMVTKADGKSHLSFMMRIPEPYYCLSLGDAVLTTASMIPDVRPATNAAKQKILAIRPRFNNWQLTYQMTWKSSECNEELLYNLTRMAGLKIGFGTFGPSHNGEFGTFIITAWATKKLSDEEAMGLEF